MRIDGRLNHEIRPVVITPHYIKHAEGSVLIEAGDTKVICTATIEDKVPPFMKGTGKGWVTAEYAMLPRATHTRNQREAAKGKQAGRTLEIQRLIARSLRSVVNLQALGERSITLDCDVIQADGGTRTTSITGAFVAMAYAINQLAEEKNITEFPIYDFLASTSVGLFANAVLVDLNYAEDSHADVDMNVVMTGQGAFVELQGTGEQSTFSRTQLDGLLTVAEHSIAQLIRIQQDALGQISKKIRGTHHVIT
jgi:ribonuclease PH